MHRLLSVKAGTYFRNTSTASIAGSRAAITEGRQPVVIEMD